MDCMELKEGEETDMNHRPRIKVKRVKIFKQQNKILRERAIHRTGQSRDLGQLKMPAAD